MSRPSPAYIALLAAICAALLLAGALLRPEPAPEDLAAATPELPQLGRFADRRMVERIAEYFSYAATLVEDTVLLLAVSGQSGVVWQVGEVVTSARHGPFPSADRTAFAGRAVELPVTATGPPRPYVLLQAPREAVVSSRPPARLYPRGSWLLAVWRTMDGDLLHQPGNLFGFLDRDCGAYRMTEVLTNFDLTPRQAGGGIFSLDGGLIAVVVDCAGEMVAAEANALELQARHRQAREDMFPERYGMRLGRVAPEEAAALGGPGPEGLVVRETWWGYGAHRAGLVPGDLIVSFESSPVTDLSDLESLLLPVSREHFDLGVWRDGSRVDVRIPARPASADTHVGLGFVGDEGGLELGSVLGGSPAGLAGARPGDRVLSVNRRPVDSMAEFERACADAAGGMAHLVLARGGRYWGAMVRVDE